MSVLFSRAFQIAAFLFLSVSIAFANQVPGMDAYVVNQPAKTLPNGTILASNVMVVSRPMPGTTLPGMVYVKTKTYHGFHKQSTSLQGSTVNATLGMTGVTEVNNAFDANTLPPSSKGLTQAIGLERIYLIKYSEPAEAFDVCLKLMSDPDVEYACPVYIHKLSFNPNDPRFASQTYLNKLGVAEAWDISKGDAKTIIAIVDSGTDWTHEDLASKIFTNTKEIPGNGKDDDGNGYVDDVRGWDFVGNVTTSEIQSGILRPDNDPRVSWPSMTDPLAHGTSTAGLAAAATDNSTGIASAGFLCTILPIKCGSDNPGPGGIYKGYDAIRYAADMGAHIINCSWGGPGVDPLGQDVIDYATAKGALVVAASGNDGLNNDSYLQSPASLKGALSVGSVSNNDAISNFTNYGWNVGVYAPGEATMTTYPGNQYKGNSGTSFSCPITAGIAGLVKSLHPTWTPEMIYHQLRSTSELLASGVGAQRPIYYGRVNAHRALRINSSFTSGERLPGIGVASFSVQGSSVISSKAPTQINIVLKNYLADAPGTTVSYSILTPGATLNSPADVTIGTIANNASSNQTITVQLKPTYPWYIATVDIGITIKSGLYTDFERVRVPVQLSTQNVFNLLASRQNLNFDQASIGFDGAMWSTGSFYNAPIYGLVTITGAQILQSTPYASTALSGINASTALIGGIRANVPRISRTANSGAAWTESDVSAIMSSVRGFAMWNSTTGLALGDPSGTRLGVAKTTNGGVAWTASSTAPTISNGEKIIAGSVFSNETSVWCGTSNDRVLYSTDQGVNWSAGVLSIGAGQILSVAFQDNSKGIALYRTGGAGSALRIATSTSSGASWTLDAFDLSKLEITAVKVASPGNHILVIGKNGEVFATDDLAKTFTPVLSREAGSVVTANARSTGTTNSVLMGGSTGSVLNYKFVSNNGTKILETSASTSVDFGSVPFQSSRQRFLQFKSVGESPVTIAGYQIKAGPGTADTAFQISIPLDSIFNPGSSNLGVKFFAADTGSFTATLTVLSNTTKPVPAIQLMARVDPPVSVEEERLQNSVVSPNPASTEFVVQLEGNAELFLHNLSGKLVRTVEAKESGRIVIDVSDLPVGVYQLTIASKYARTTKVVTISR